MIGRITRFETSRYAMVGMTVAVLSNVVLIGGDRLGIAYPVLVAEAWALSGTLAYLLHARWTFRQAPGGAAYARFMAGSALGVPLAMAAVWLFFQALRWPMAVAAPAHPGDVRLQLLQRAAGDPLGGISGSASLVPPPGTRR